MSLVRNGCISTTDQRVDRKKFDENWERIFGKFVSRGLHGRLPKKEEKYYAVEDRNSAVAKMHMDKTLIRRIKNGDPLADKGIRREAETIEREGMKKRKEDWLHKKREALHQARIQLRKAGGYSE